MSLQWTWWLEKQCEKHRHEEVKKSPTLQADALLFELPGKQHRRDIWQPFEFPVFLTVSQNCGKFSSVSLCQALDLVWLSSHIPFDWNPEFPIRNLLTFRTQFPVTLENLSPWLGSAHLLLGLMKGTYGAVRSPHSGTVSWHPVLSLVPASTLRIGGVHSAFLYQAAVNTLVYYLHGAVPVCLSCFV